MVRRGVRRLDYFTLVTFLLLLIPIGLVALASASSDLGKVDFNDQYFYLKDQLIFGIGIGVIGFLVAYFTNYRIYKKLAPLILGVSVILLLLLFTPLGVEAGGAQRWIAVGPLTIQPSELLKLTIVIYLAAWLAKSKGSREKSFSEGLVPFVSIIGFIGLILLFQRSTSAALIVGAAALAVYIASGARWSFVSMMMLVGAVVLAGFVASTPYRLERFESFLNPSESSQDASFQANQALTVIGSGGVFGVGLGQSTAKHFLPERIGDSIFAIIAEEGGFVVATLVILLFISLVIRSLILAKRTRDKFGKLILVGCATVIGVQAFLHMASASALVPTTGVPLPFISYGNFSMVVFMTMVGVMLNVHRNS